MKCKECGNLIEELQADRCPHCGADLTGDADRKEQKMIYSQPESVPEKKSKKPLIVVLVLVLVLALAAGGLYFGFSKGSAGDGSTVVAEFGENKLRNNELTYYYWGEYRYLYDQYGEYLDTLVDLSKPLDEQEIQNGMTWHDYFVQNGANTWGQTKRLVELAAEENFEMPQEYWDDLEKLSGTLGEAAQANGYADVDSYLQETYGSGATYDGYYNYVKESNMAAAYLAHKYADIYRENEHLEGQMTYCVNVRHILIQPDGEGDAAWAAAEKQAQALYEEWQKDATEDNFAAMAEEHTQDPGSAKTGGLYKDVQPGQMVPEFNDWCFDEVRQPGDHGVVKTDYGFHIMYMVGDGAEYKDAASIAAEEAFQNWQQETFGNMSFSVDIEKVNVK